MMMFIQNLVKFRLFFRKVLSKKQFLTSIKGHSSVANLLKMMLYNHNMDLVNDNVYTNLVKYFVHFSQDFEHNKFLPSIKGSNCGANLQNMTLYNTNLDLVNDNVYTIFGLN